MDGIIVVDKPISFTSFDVVAKLRGILQTKKIGHGGTLDPMATGVLPVFVGTATKAIDLAPNQDKAYEATILFGTRTNTGDITGTVLEQSDIQIKKSMLQDVLQQFIGEQSQLPPMYSAVKINGKPLYKYAREGKDITRNPRIITITYIKLLCEQKPNQFVISVYCGKGTYIRTLAEDIGAALGVPSTLSALRRTKSGCFTQQQAISLNTIQEAKNTGTLPSIFTPTEVLFSTLPALNISEEDFTRLSNGAAIYRTGVPAGRYRAMLGDVFLGLATVNAEGTAKAEKIFVSR